MADEEFEDFVRHRSGPLLRTAYLLCAGTAAPPRTCCRGLAEIGAGAQPTPDSTLTNQMTTATMPAASSMRMPTPTDLAVTTVERHAARPSDSRSSSPRYTPTTAPITSPTTGIRKKPAIAPMAPSRSVDLGAPACFNDRLGSTYFATVPAASTSIMIPKTTHGTTPSAMI